jgi:hypothetical protein
MMDGIAVARGKAVAVDPSTTNAALFAEAQNNADAPLGRRDFGPGAPLEPRSTPASAERTLGPRQFQAPITANLRPVPRSEYANLTPMAQLRSLSELYDVLAICIATRIEEASGLSWSIAPKDKRGDRSDSRIKQITRFWEQPDGLNEFPTWFSMLLYDLFTIDAPTLYKRQTRGGSLYALEVVDGATIKPLLDDRGRTLAYQQILWGYPYSQYSRPSADQVDEKLPIYAPEQLIYRPRWARSYTPYGFPPSEWIILRVNQALRKQTFDLSYFTAGNVPEAMAWPPGESLNPEQVYQFEEQFNALLAGNDDARRRIRFFPWQMNVKEFREFSYETKLDEWMLKITCAATGVPPQEIGFTADVNKASATLQQSVNERRGLRPLMAWWKGLFDRIIAEDFKADDLEFQWHFGESSDRLIVAQTDQIYVNMGAITVEAITAMRFGDVVNVEEEQAKLAEQAAQKQADQQAQLDLAQAKAMAGAQDTTGQSQPKAGGKKPSTRGKPGTQRQPSDQSQPEAGGQKPVARGKPGTQDITGQSQPEAGGKKPVTRGKPGAQETTGQSQPKAGATAKKLEKAAVPAQAEDAEERMTAEKEIQRVMNAYFKQQKARIKEALDGRKGP